MTWKRRGVIVVCIAAMGLLGAAPASASDYVRIKDSLYAEPKGGSYEQTNPEGNYDKLCRKGRNGGIPWLRKGAKFPIVDGNHKRIGTLRVVDAWWGEDDNPMTGTCAYDFTTTKLPRVRYYCVRLPDGKIRQLTSRRSDDKSKVLSLSLFAAFIYGPGYVDRFNEDLNKFSNCANR